MMNDPKVGTSPPPVRRTGKLAHLLDTFFRIPGTRIRFGIDPLLGLFPGVGDAAGALLSGYVIIEAIRSGASRAVLLRMLANLGIDSLLSVVPLLGDLLDIGWKANTRNLALLQRHLANPTGTAAASRIFIVLLLLALAALIVATAALTITALRWLAGVLG